MRGARQVYIYVDAQLPTAICARRRSNCISSSLLFLPTRQNFRRASARKRAPIGIGSLQLGSFFFRLLRLLPPGTVHRANSRLPGASERLSQGGAIKAGYIVSEKNIPRRSLGGTFATRSPSETRRHVSSSRLREPNVD